jgi:pimeloyl-ACP methyl ester carboxylesterase
VAGHALDIDEFGGLEDAAADFAIPVADLPEVRREETHTSDGVVSSLVWGLGPAEVVLLHGDADNAHTWDAVILALGRSALAIDLPGHGHSAWRDDGRYDPRLLAPALARVLERFAPAAGVVVGQSLGALAAVALADLREDLVRGQILVDFLPGAARAAALRSLFEGPDGFERRDDMVERVLQHGFGARRDAAVRAVVLNTIQRPDGRWVWRHHFGQDPGSMSTLGDPGALWPSLQAFPGPVTLVRAGHGTVAGDQVAELRRRIPSADVVAVDTGHNVQGDDPVALAGVIDARLA